MNYRNAPNIYKSKFCSLIIRLSRTIQVKTIEPVLNPIVNGRSPVPGKKSERIFLRSFFF